MCDFCNGNNLVDYILKSSPSPLKTTLRYDQGAFSHFPKSGKGYHLIRFFVGFSACEDNK